MWCRRSWPRAGARWPAKGSHRAWAKFEDSGNHRFQSMLNMNHPFLWMFQFYGWLFNMKCRTNFMYPILAHTQKHWKHHKRRLNQQNAGERETRKHENNDFKSVRKSNKQTMTKKTILANMFVSNVASDFLNYIPSNSRIIVGDKPKYIVHNIENHLYSNG